MLSDIHWHKPGFELAVVRGGLPDPELNLLVALENFIDEIQGSHLFPHSMVKNGPNRLYNNL